MSKSATANHQETSMHYWLHILVGMIEMVLLIVVLAILLVAASTAYEEWREKREGKRDPNTIF